MDKRNNDLLFDISIEIDTSDVVLKEGGKREEPTFESLNMVRNLTLEKAHMQGNSVCDYCSKASPIENNVEIYEGNCCIYVFCKGCLISDGLDFTIQSSFQDIKFSVSDSGRDTFVSKAFRGIPSSFIKRKR